MKKLPFVTFVIILAGAVQINATQIQPGLYWSNQGVSVNGTIKRADFDGQNVTTLYTDPPGDIQLRDVTIDQISGNMYFTGFGYNVPSKIQKRNVDGGITELLYQTSEAAIRSIIINQNEGKMYWTEEFHLIHKGRIARADLDGSNVEYILTNSPSLGMMPYGLDIDPLSNKLYWTDNLYDIVYKCNTDGSNLESVLSTARNPTGISLDSDNRKIYLVEEFGNIICANFDGTGIETLLDHGSHVIDLDIDLNANKIYWGDYYSGNIMRANLDGSGVATVVTDQSWPNGIMVVSIPEPTTFLLFSLGGLVIRKKR